MVISRVKFMTEKGELITFLTFVKGWVYAWLLKKPDLESLKMANTELNAITNAVDRLTIEPLNLSAEERLNLKPRYVYEKRLREIKVEIKQLQHDKNRCLAVLAELEKE